MRKAVKRAKVPHITVARAVELMTLDDEWPPWLAKHRLDQIFCHTLTPLNERLTVWRADCYETVGNVVVFTAGQNPDTITQIIETDPGKKWWLA